MTAKKKTVKIIDFNWKTRELDLNNYMPEDLYKYHKYSKCYYVPIEIFRDILRQLPEFWIPKFEDFEDIYKWKTKDWNWIRVLRQKVKLLWWVEEQPIEIEWIWYHNVTDWKLFEWTLWNMKILEARTLRDALKNTYRIFDKGEIHVDDWTETTEWTQEAKATAAEIVQEQQENQENNKTQRKKEVEELMWTTIMEMFDEQMKGKDLTLSNLRSAATWVKQKIEQALDKKLKKWDVDFDIIADELENRKKNLEVK